MASNIKNRLQETNLDLASILSDINSLPPAGTEDASAELDAQTLAVNNLIKIVNRKVAENNGEGEYVWKKYEKPVSITMTQQTSGSNPTTFKVESTDVDLSTVDVSYFVGFKGTYAVSGSSASFEIKEDGLYMGDSLRGALTYDVTTQVLSCAGSIGSLCIWVVETKQEFIDYIVSDSEFAYPNGEEQDGYWYAGVKEGSDVATGSVVFTTASGTSSVTISLPFKPRMMAFSRGISGMTSTTSRSDQCQFVFFDTDRNICWIDNVYYNSSAAITINDDNSVYIRNGYRYFGAYEYYWFAVA